MKREYIKKANELDNEILNIENLIKIWKKSESFESFDGKIQSHEPGIGVRIYEVKIKDIPFKKIKQMFLEHYEAQKQIKERELQSIL
jgi:hypothetical protein